MNRVLLLLVHVYRWVLSPAVVALFGPAVRCRFHPTCSAYAEEALRRHGPWKGSGLALRRLSRCHPWGGAGHDPVPGGAREAGPEGVEALGGRSRSAVLGRW